MSDNFSTPYSSYDVLAKWDSPSWDDRTRQVIAARLNADTPRRFFAEREWALLESLASRILPQPDRAEAPIPIVDRVDAQLARGASDGFRFSDMPPDAMAWRLGLTAVDEESVLQFGRTFCQLAAHQQDSVLASIQSGEVSAATWRRVPPARFFRSVLLKAVVGAYYAHPTAWSEVGFGGPASPRGYVRLGTGDRDPWEAEAADE